MISFHDAPTAGESTRSRFLWVVRSAVDGDDIDGRGAALYPSDRPPTTDMAWL